MSRTADEPVIVGEGDFRYEVATDWPRLPEGWTFVESTSVAADSQGLVYVFNRGEHPVMVLDREGQVVKSWGEGKFTRPHGITIAPDDSIYCVDDQDHTVRKYSSGGELLFTVGTSGQGADTGVVNRDYRTIKRVGPPFNQPTNLAIAPGGELFISDGYGNARVHKFSPDGDLIMSWGEPGDGPGQFHLPHGIAIDSSGTVYVADRENNRVQRFNSDGEFIDQWSNLARPTQVCICPDETVFVSEVGFRVGMVPGTAPPGPDATGGRISLFDANGELLCRWGGGQQPTDPGDFVAPHDVCVDPQGAVYVAEVSWSAAGKHGLVPPDFQSLQKFVRVS